MSDESNSKKVQNRRNSSKNAGILLNPIDVLNRAREAVPAVNYALALAGIAAAGALVVGFIGYSQASILLFGLLFIGMILVFVFSKLVVSKSPSIQTAGLSLMWLVMAFFSLFLLFTVAAVAVGWPCNWADVLRVKSSCGPQVMVDGMAPKDAAEILDRQANQVSIQMFRLRNKLTSMRSDIFKRGVDTVVERNGAQGNQIEAEDVLLRTADEVQRLKRSFGSANFYAKQYLEQGKIEAARRAQNEALTHIASYNRFCSSDVYFSLNDGGRAVLIPLTEWSDCGELPHYGLEGLASTE